MIAAIGEWWLAHWLPVTLWSALWFAVGFGLDRVSRSTVPAGVRLGVYALPVVPLFAALGVAIPVRLPAWAASAAASRPAPGSGGPAAAAV